MHMPTSLPEWVKSYKNKGLEIKSNNGNYYLYKRTTVYDKKIGGAKKISGEYLGKITPDGLIPPKKHSAVSVIRAGIKPVLLEYGSSKYLCGISDDILSLLKTHFQNEWQMIYVITILRTIYKIPFKRLQDRYSRSYLSIEYPGLDMSGKNISGFLKNLGDRRKQISEFMKACFNGNQYMLFDGTNITSFSKEMEYSRVGFNKDRNFNPQVSLLYAFSYGLNPTPAYYRVIPGNIKDASAFKLTIEEMGIQDAVVVADKAFSIAKNFRTLQNMKLKYVAPLKRNSKKYDRQVFKNGGKACFDGSFLFNDRPIWHYEKFESLPATDGTRVIVYLDSELQYREERDYMRRLDKRTRGYSQERMLSKQYEFGILILQCNITGSARDVYEVYKQRLAIEQSFDCLKNVLGQDSTYMQDDISLEGWCFLNHLSLVLCYRIYTALKKAGMIKKYSVNDVLDLFSAFHKVQINNQWHDSEISSKTLLLMRNIGFV
jgi:transposase